ncbi:MAG TPA: hypothetical protein VLH09_06205, partial [Bryobacteraceae bacterium]|nr:hypothetical protein [Bryobacteraceae bacterium]
LAAGAGGAGYLAATHPALQGFRDQMGQVATQGMDVLHPAITNAQANTQHVVDAVPGAISRAGDFYADLGRQVMDLLHSGGHQALGAVGL